ncbi:unnamed protein product [Rotaria sordida]|uniref:Uncharacterized protein n=1 Tax=Rotaria sordida TaxID=392033 RepID=A0A814CXD6_9BILA|nr:unnamed protein product [Rotaria sordida]CAF0964839.1 unnamed protein product [Rotaria sordida]CAF1081303.1 unnamed protein product [Rotaria sordida]CAF1111846.1 unnamed protein product [Rotaria sordida]CAF1116469.1 unnamed protein product [Rotaria sordida]
MYSIQHDSNNSSYETMNYIRSQQQQQQQQQLISHNRKIIKTKQYYFWSTKFYENQNKSKDILPVYQTLCTFEKSRNDDGNGMFHRSPLISFCVPDVYSSGSNGTYSPPPSSSNLPPPPSEWLP